MALSQPVNAVPPVVLVPRARPLSVQLMSLAGFAAQMVFFAVIIIVLATPFVWMILGSLRPPAEIFAYIYPLSINTFVPVKWTFQAYLDVLGLSPEGQSAGLDFARYTFNTVFVSACVVACSLVFNTGAAYFFSRLEFPYKEVIFVFVVATMLIPWEATIVPLYLAAERPVVQRDGQWIMVDDERFAFAPGETAETRRVRFRTLGCYPLTAAIESDADTLEAVIAEIFNARSSERQGRLIDSDVAGSMEKKKKEGYF